MTKRVTDEQDQGDIGQLQVHEYFKTLRWQPRPLTPDLGEDFIFDIYDNGKSAGLAFYVQVKSSAELDKYQLKSGDYSYPIYVKDLNHWRDYSPPVVLILWDTTKRRGYWGAVPELVAELSKKTPKWDEKKKSKNGTEPTVSVLVSGENVLDEKGVKALRHKVLSLVLPAIMKGKTLDLKIEFAFPKDEHGETQKEAMRRFVEQGESVIIDGKFIKGMKFSNWYERKYGEVEIDPEIKISLGPRRSEQVDKFRLSLLSPQGRALQVELVETKATRVGEKQITFTNEHLPKPFAFTLVIEASGHYKVNISMAGSKTTAGEALKACDFFDAGQDGGKRRIEMLTRPEQWGTMSRVETPIEKESFATVDPLYRQLLERLNFIEQKTGVAFTLTDEGIGRDDVEAILDVEQILQTGKHVDSFKKRSQTLEGAKTPNGGLNAIKALLESWRKKEPVFMSGDTEQVEVEILGIRVPLGRELMSLSGMVENACARRLEKIENKGASPKDLSFTLLNGEHVREYVEWLSEPPTLRSLPQAK